MPIYKVRYKTDADRDHREWRLGRLPDKSSALATFNAMPTKDISGTFEFFSGPAHREPLLEEYYLIEQDQPNGPENSIPIYRKR